MLNLYYFTSASGRNLVKEFIGNLPTKTQDKIYTVIDFFETYGFHLETQYLRRMSGTQALWELRIKHQSNQYRIFLARLENNAAVFLHAIVKKTQKTPTQDIETAEHRLAEVKTSLQKGTK